MISLEHYRETIIEGVTALETITVPIGQAHGLVLAADATAKLAVPPFTNSAMDGFAVKCADVQNASDSAPVTLNITGDIPAGVAPSGKVEAGCAHRIMTGAALPAGADAIVPVELTNIPPGPHPLPATIQVYAPVTCGQHIRQEADDVALGDTIVSGATRLGAAQLSSLVSVGYGEVVVHRRPRVAIMATGDELAAPGVMPPPGHIPDSNSTLVTALVDEAGGEAIQVATSTDQPAELLRILRETAADADLIITTGGVSAGAYDVVKEATSKRGMTFTKVAMQPGKPQGHGVIELDGRTVPLLSLPGNPVSVFVSFHMFAIPLLAVLGGLERNKALNTHRRRMATATVGWPSPTGRRQLAPVTLEEPTRPGDLPTVTPTHRLGSGSHLVASLHRANALAMIPEAVDQVAQWDVVEVIEL
ncbi:MAG: molybdopterin molybdotransferase MoeA [Bowdeniella nasicola]|nr:molybdopterin molybdotransferase MoeA [Bowdeniella nasicola]